MRPVFGALLALVVLASVGTLFPALDFAPLERAEIYFVDGARSMVERGDYLFPLYRGEPFFDKPALTYWLIGGSFRLLGYGLAAARFVPALAGIGVVLATVWLGTLLLDRRSALAGGLALAATVGFMTFGRVAMSDMLLVLWTTLAFGLTLRGWQPARPPWVVPALGAVLGLGFLTKGPVALLLAGLGMLAIAWRRRRPSLTKGEALAGAVLFALFGLGWFGAVYARLGSAPLVHFFLRENIERFAGETYDAGRAPWFYLGAYVAEGAPWSLFLPLAAWRLARPAGQDPPGAQGARLLLSWAGLMLVPLSLSRGKIDYYILPLYPPVSLAIGHFFAMRTWGALERSWGRAALLLTGAAVALAPYVSAHVPSPWMPEGVRSGLTLLAYAAALVLAGVALRLSPTWALVGTAAVSASMFAAFVTWAVPAFTSAQPNGAIVEAVRRERARRPNVQVVLCQDPTRVQRDLLFHARVAVRERCDLWAAAASGRPSLFILQKPEKKALGEIRGFRVLSRHAYLPATVSSLTGLFAAPRPEAVFLLASYPEREGRARGLRRR